MKIRTPKTFKAKVHECTALILSASRTYKNDKYRRIGININRFDGFIRANNGTKRSLDVRIFKEDTAHWCDGTKYSTSDIDKGMFFNSLILGISMQNMFWECVCSELLKQFNYDECYRQNIGIREVELLKHLGISL